MVFHGWNNFTSTTYLPTYLPTCLPACLHAHSNSLPVAALTLDQIQILLHLHCLIFLFTSKQTHKQTHTHTDKVVVGSFQGMLRVCSPASESFSPHRLSLEKKTNPILQVAVGRFGLLRAYVPPLRLRGIIQLSRIGNVVRNII